MIRTIRTNVVAILALVMTSGMTSPGYAQEQLGSERLQQAIALLEASETERGITILEQLLSGPPNTRTPSLTSQALVHLATALFSLGNRDSAEVFYREALETYAFTRLDEKRYNPAITTVFERLLAVTPAIAFRTTLDATINPGSETWPLEIAVSKPGVVSIRMGLAGSRTEVAPLASVRLDGDTIIDVPFTIGDTTSFQSGTYRLTAEYLTEDQLPPTIMEVEVTRLPVDTLLHRPPIEPVLFRQERRPGKLEIKTLLPGAALGILATTLPALLSHSNLGRSIIGVRVITFSLAVAATGFTGAYLGRPQSPIPANIEYNSVQHREWSASNDSTAAENNYRLRFPSLRVRVVGER